MTGVHSKSRYRGGAVEESVIMKLPRPFNINCHNYFKTRYSAEIFTKTLLMFAFISDLIYKMYL